MPIFSSKNKQGNLSCNFSYVDGIDKFNRGTAVCAVQEDAESQLSIYMRTSKTPAICVKYANIKAAGLLTEKEIREKSKSVIGRAAVGGLLLGPLGAIVGGISGVGNKQKPESHYYFVINYNGVAEEARVISLEIVDASLHWLSFMKALKQKV
jgi:hypothetical protein